MRLAATMAVFAVPTLAHAQRLTIPEEIARGGVARIWRGEPSGQLPTVTELLAQADLIVIGTVGIPNNSYLSDDQYDIYTDYPIVDPIILYQSQLSTSPRPGMPGTVSVTQLGGTATIGRASFSQSSSALQPLDVGTEGLFVMKRVEGKYRFVSDFLGAFRITGGRLESLFDRLYFAAEGQDAPADQALANVAARLRALGR